MSKKDSERLMRWQDTYSRNKEAYESIRTSMDRRELLYNGMREIKSPDGGDARDATHVRNIIYENIESEVDINIPQPKVTAKRREDEVLAKKIEDMLRNKLDMLPFEVMNDISERTTTIQGGSYFICDWNNQKRTHTTVGDVEITVEHPKQIIPQQGIFGSIEEMDYLFIESPQTKQTIKRVYGIDVSDENESVPEIRGMNESASNDMVTQIICYFRNADGGIGRISWVNDTELEYYEDYRARRLMRCKKCGAPGNGTCTYCSSKAFEAHNEEYEEIYDDIVLSDGRVISCREKQYENDIPLLEPLYTPSGRTYYEDAYSFRKIPYYKPNIYPLILRKNVSVYGQLLGDSDVDKMEDQQNTIKKLSTKIGEKLLKGGSVLTLPADLCIEPTDEEFQIVRVDTPDKMSMMSVFNVQADINGDLTYMHQVYEESRQVLGITDSFQGRNDSTAVSGVAKEFAAAQSAGRLESKRIMKNAAYAQLFEMIFKLMLAYADEPRTVSGSTTDGETAYKEFNRYDFLCEDECGKLYWNDDFLFSCDTSSPLSTNREQMWEETRRNLAEGTYGNPANPDTLILFWRNMELLHYPGASETKRYLTENAQREVISNEGESNLRGQDNQQKLAGSDRTVCPDPA